MRKWQTLIEANITVKTTDDYLLRLFAIGFTKRRPNQVKKTTYAASSQIRAIRKKMVEIIQREAATCTLQQLTSKLIPEVIGREIEKSTQGIYPLQNVRRTCVCPDSGVTVAIGPAIFLYSLGIFNHGDANWAVSLGPHPQGQAPQGAQVRPGCSHEPARRVHDERGGSEGGAGV